MPRGLGYVEREKLRIAKLKKHEVTDKERGRIEALAGYGFTSDQIAADLGISKRTLYKHYKHEMQTAHIKANALVAQNLFRKATNPEDSPGAVTAAIFWMKVRAGWKEAQVIEGSNDPSKALVIKLLPGDEKL